MTALFQLAAEHRALSDKLHDLDLDEQTIADTLEGEAGDLIEKGKNVAAVFRNLESDAKQIKEAEQQLAERRKAIEKRAEALKQYLKTNMEHAGIQKIESPWFVVSLKNNPESVVIDDAEKIPEDYLRVIPASYAPDKALMKTAMQDGYEIPGAHLERGKRIEVK
jgi:uncharacterized protein YeeX (DUF496 family)